MDMAAAWGRRAILGGATALAAAGAVHAQGRPGAPTIVNNVLIGRDGWLFSAAGEPPGTYIRAVDQSVADLITEAAGIIRGAGIEPVLVLLPSKNRVYRPQTGSPASPPEFMGRYAFLLGQLRRANTIAPDVDGIFRRAIAQQPGEGLYFRTDTHWTPRGAELTAAVLAQALRESGKLGPAPRPGTALAPPVTMTHTIGDLQRLLPDNRRGQFPPEEYRIRLPVQAGAAALLDDGAADVALVGPSFLEPRYSYHNVASNQLGRAVQLSWRPNTTGPYGILLEYLRSVEFRTQRPKVLVWHLLEINMASGPNVTDWNRFAMPAPQFRTELRRLVGG